MPRITIQLYEDQYKELSRIAQQQKCSLSAVIREMLQVKLEAYQRHDLKRAAQTLLHDYTHDSELTVYTVLDGEGIHTGT